MAAPPLNPPNFGEENAPLYTDTGGGKVQLKIANLLGGASRAVAITPNDGADLPHIGAVYCGTVTAGQTVKVDCALSGNTITFTNPPQGGLLPVQVRRVYSTGTSATNLICVY